MRRLKTIKYSVFAVVLSAAMLMSDFTYAFAAESVQVSETGESFDVNETDAESQTDEETGRGSDDITDESDEQSEDFALEDDEQAEDLTSEDDEQSEDLALEDDEQTEDLSPDEEEDETDLETEKEDVNDTDSDEELELMGSKIYSDTLVPDSNAEGTEKYVIRFKTSYRSNELFKYKLYYSSSKFTENDLNLSRVKVVSSELRNLDKDTGEGIIHLLNLIQDGHIREGGYFMACIEMYNHDVKAMGECFELDLKHRFSTPLFPKWEDNTAVWNPVTDAYEYEVIFRDETKEYDYDPIMVKGDSFYKFTPKSEDKNDYFTFKVCACPNYYESATSKYRVNGYVWSSYSEKSSLQRPGNPLLSISNIHIGNFNKEFLGTKGDKYYEEPDRIFFTAPASNKTITYTCSLYRDTGGGYAPTFIGKESYSCNASDKETTVNFNIRNLHSGNTISKNYPYHVEITGKYFDGAETKAIKDTSSNQFYFLDGIDAKLIKNSDGTMMFRWDNTVDEKNASVNTSYFKWQKLSGSTWVDIDRTGEEKQNSFDPATKGIANGTKIRVRACNPYFLGESVSNEVEAGAESGGADYLKGTLTLTYSNAWDDDIPRIGNQAMFEADFTPDSTQKHKTGSITYNWYVDGVLTQNGVSEIFSPGSAAEYVGKYVRCTVTSSELKGEVLSTEMGPLRKISRDSEISYSNLSNYINWVEKTDSGYVSKSETNLTLVCNTWTVEKASIVEHGQKPTYSGADFFYAVFSPDTTEYTQVCNYLTPGETYDIYYYIKEDELYESVEQKITVTMKAHSPEEDPDDNYRVKYYKDCIMHWKRCRYSNCLSYYDYEKHYDNDHDGKCDVCKMPYSDDVLYILNNNPGVANSGTENLGDYEYTGKKICPDVQVYCGGQLLQQGRDYKLSYSNNIKVCQFDAKTTDKKGKDVYTGPSVTATGIGNYSGSCTIHFSIVAADISAADIQDVLTNYSKKAIKISPAVKLYGTTLSAGKDYKFVLHTSGGDELADSYTYTEADGPHTVTIRGINNYKGETTFNFEILKELKSISTLKIDALPNQNYTGMPISKAQIKSLLKSNKVSLDEILGAENYDVNLDNNVDPGKTTATIFIKEGKATECGYSTLGSKQVTFNIVANDMKNAGLSFSKVQYTGESIGIAYDRDITFKKADGTVIKLGKEDCSFELSNSVNKGTAKITLTGKGIYSGTKTVSFTIEPMDAVKAIEKYESYSDKTNATGLRISKPENITYDPKGACWEPEIVNVISTGNEQTLVKGKDYKLSYANNKKACGEGEAKAPEVTITFLGNYKGTKKIKYTIKPCEPTAEYPVMVSDISAKYTGKTIAVKPVVKFMGTTLKQGTDYDIYLYGTDEPAGTGYSGVGKHQLEVRLKGNYKGSSAPFTFEIFNADFVLLNSFKVAKIPNQSYVNPVTAPADKIFGIEKMGLFSGKDVTGKNVKNATISELMSSDFYSIKYSNTTPDGKTIADDCTSIGTVTAVIKAEKSGPYRGSIEVTYNIVGNDINGAKLTSAIPDKSYTGSAVTLSASDINLVYKTLDGEQHNLDFDDYDISYDTDNVNAGKVTITLKGKKEYSGTKKLTYTIKPYDAVKDGNSRIMMDGTLMDNKTISIEYSPDGANPKPEIKFGGTVLKEGTDYTVKYANNKKVASKTDAKAPTMTFTFKKNLSGTRTVKYNITPKSIEGVSVTIPDLGYNSKAGAWKQTKITVKDETKALKASTAKVTNDYSVEYFKDQACLTPFDDTMNDGSNPDVYVRITGEGNYTGSCVAQYHIGTINISTVTVDPLSLKYLGEGSKLTFAMKNKPGMPREFYYYIQDGEGKEYQLKVRDKDKKVLRAKADFVIVSDSYLNNENKGTASLTIQGTGKYYGTKTIKFNIIQQVFRWWKNLIS